MKKHFFVLGSGRMARNIGLWLVGLGCEVAWITADQGRRRELAALVEKRYRRMASGADGAVPQPRICSPADVSSTPPDIIIEAGSESLAAKQRAIASVSSLISSETLLLTTTSSILPWSIHPRCLGMHFFYPVELTGLVELVMARDTAPAQQARLASWTESLGLSAIIEHEENAFSANRLLLPLQAETLGLLDMGFSPVDVDACTVSGLLPVGQLSLMDSIGASTIVPSIRNYVSRMEPEERRDYGGTIEILNRFSVPGHIEGARSDVRFLEERTGCRRMNEHERHDFARTLLYLFINSCCTFVENHLLDMRGLELIFASVFRGQASLTDVVGKEKASEITSRLASLFTETGRRYFKPSRAIEYYPDIP